MVQEKQKQQQHFLLVSLPVQSHINPVLRLAHCLTHAGAHVTFSTSISGHRRMFPKNPTFPLADPHDHFLTYHPYSDGVDEGFDHKGNPQEYMSRVKIAGSRTLRSIAITPATDTRPAVTCLICALLLPWVNVVAHDLGLPCILFWIQPAAVFTAYYHYFHGCKTLVDAHHDDPSFLFELPGLPSLRIRDLPSFLVNRSESDLYDHLLRTFEEMYSYVDGEIEGGVEVRRSIVLLNSFEPLEHDVLVSLEDKVNLIPIGPLLPSVTKNGGFVEDLIKSNEGKAYMEWLDQWPEKSVVYMSFGSLSVLGKKQNEEFSQALTSSGRPFLWVVKDDREGVEVAEGGKGRVVKWCSQVDVLDHKSIGCFVTHCGWNSSLETLACGVPTVAFPQWSDQTMNARLMEGLWRTGVRVEVGEDGVVKAEELRRCLELVMGEGERGVEIRRNAEMWKEKAQDALSYGGSSDKHLAAFLSKIDSLDISRV